jgi:hypothetical protein
VFIRKNRFEQHLKTIFDQIGVYFDLENAKVGIVERILEKMKWNSINCIQEYCIVEYNFCIETLEVQLEKTHELIFDNWVTYDKNGNKI